MLAKFVCSSHFTTIWLLLLLSPLGCGSDDELMKDGRTVDGAPVLISTIPISGGILPSYGTLFMNFSKPPGVVTVNGTLAVVAENNFDCRSLGRTQVCTSHRYRDLFCGPRLQNRLTPHDLGPLALRYCVRTQHLSERGCFSYGWTETC